MSAFSAQLALVVLEGCGPQAPKVPDLSILRLPTATLVDPQGRGVFITQGNWDRQDDYSALLGFSKAPIDARWDNPGAEGCWVVDDAVPRCDIRPFLLPGARRLIPSGAGNIVYDQRPSVPKGRLLVPTRHRSAVVWMDLVGQGDTFRLECGQGVGLTCHNDHILDAVAPEPSRLYLDQQGFDFAYLPHLLETRLSLLSLTGPDGPTLVDQENRFFSGIKVNERNFGGGLGLAQIPCDPQRSYMPRAARACSRPYLYGGQRFLYGLRPFSVAPGRKVILSGSPIELQGHAEQDKPKTGWPTMGAMWVGPGPELFVVQHEPPLLLRLSLKLDKNQEPENRVLDALPLCNGADLMQSFDGPAGGPRLALACPRDAEVWVVDPQVMRLTGRVEVGRGANEIWYEVGKKRLWVTNTLDASVSLVDVDPSSSRYLQERLRLVTQDPPSAF